MKMYGEWRYSSRFLTSALDGSEWSASCPCRSTSGDRAPGTHWIGGWVGLRPVWTLWRRDKSCAPTGNQTPSSPKTRRHTDWGIPACRLYPLYAQDGWCTSDRRERFTSADPREHSIIISLIRTNAGRQHLVKVQCTGIRQSTMCIYTSNITVLNNIEKTRVKIGQRANHLLVTLAVKLQF
jgi:hypothetical protein